MNSRSFGQLGEDEACKYLQDKGYKIIERNFSNRLGEIDIIAQQGKMLCFVEVKIRKSLKYGAPFEAVHSTKQMKMVRLALSYLKFKFHSIDILSRFDVISINKDAQGRLILEHIINAFDLSYLSH